MKVSSERIAESQVIINIEFEPETIEKSMDRAYRRLVTKTNIPGFRKGKAPRAMLERYIGRTALLEEALDIIFPEAYEEALREQNIDAIGQPKVELAQVEPVILKAIVPVRPTVKLGNYKDIRAAYAVPETTDEEVEAVVEQARNRAASREPVDRPVQYDDLVTMDIESTVDGTPSGSNQGIEYYVVEGTDVPVPGFVEHVVGMTKGEVKDIDVTFPEDDEHEDLAGKKFLFNVTVNEIKEKKLPELDDEFAKSVSDEYENLEQLRTQIRKNLQQQAEVDARDRLEDEVVGALISGSEIEFPPQLTEHEVEHMIEDQREQMKNRGIALEQYLRLVNKTMEQHVEEQSSRARDRITRTLVLDELADVEGLTVSTEEVDAEIDAMVAKNEDAASVREAWNLPSSRSSLERALIRQKTINYLIEIATEGAIKASPSAAAEVVQELNEESPAVSEATEGNTDEEKTESGND